MGASQWAHVFEQVPFLKGLPVLLFFFALGHTFLTNALKKKAHDFSETSFLRQALHFLGEVEVVFPFWAGVYLLCLGLYSGKKEVLNVLQQASFEEPLFVFFVMTLCATQPILALVTALLEGVTQRLPFPREISFYAVTLGFGPLLGGFITEPAAMTVLALLLLQRYQGRPCSLKFRYATLGLLFVNVSIGGVWTPYAAPPLLMVVSQWHWDLRFVVTQFGWKAWIAVLLSTVWILRTFVQDFRALEACPLPQSELMRRGSGLIPACPVWVSLGQLGCLGLLLSASHSIPLLCLFFMLFLGYVQCTSPYQTPLRLKESFLVGCFLGGLVLLGKPQAFWLEPLLSVLSEGFLYTAAIVLTAFTDNAALTYLGAQVPTLSEASRYLLVAGAVTGGGLTVIANAPNPAGQAILQPLFEGDGGVKPLPLFLAALVPTGICACCFWFL